MWMSLIQTNMFAQLEMRRPVLKPTLKPKLKRPLLLQVSILMVKFFRENQFDGVFFISRKHIFKQNNRFYCSLWSGDYCVASIAKILWMWKPSQRRRRYTNE